MLVTTTNPSYRDLAKFHKHNRFPGPTEIRFVRDRTTSTWHMWTYNPDFPLFHEDYINTAEILFPDDMDYGYIYISKLTNTVTYEPYKMRHNIPSFVNDYAQKFPVKELA